MILPDREIRARYDLEAGYQKLTVEPEPDWESQLQPASLDLRLGNEIALFNGNGDALDGGIAIDPGKTDLEALMERFTIPDMQTYRLDPREFILATTFERVVIPKDIVARVEGRSSFGRLGLIVHSTAGYIDPGFDGHITLEMTNIGRYPILLRPGTRICQLAFSQMVGVPDKPYQGKYQGQRGVTPSRSNLDSK